MATEFEGREFSLAEAREIVRDLSAPLMWIYWADFLATILVGHAAYLTTIGLYELHWQPLWLRLLFQAALFAIQCSCYYRASMFVHEIVHLPEQQVWLFRPVWNLLCGVPFLVPSFTYHTHLDHHRKGTFGTRDDGEYLQLASQSPWQIVLYFSQCLWIPPLVLVRFGLLTPLSWFCPPLRRWMHARMSSLVIDPAYVRPQPTREEARYIARQELFCLVYLVLGLVILPWYLQKSPLPVLLYAYVSAVVVLFLNALRTITAHRFWSEGEESSFLEQLLDSVVMDNDSLPAVVLHPVGLRYHATHHLFPALPYHNLGAAHRRLMTRLPSDSPYHRTVERSTWAVFCELWARSRGRMGAGVGETKIAPAQEESPAPTL